MNTKPHSNRNATTSKKYHAPVILRHSRLILISTMIAACTTTGQAQAATTVPIFIQLQNNDNISLNNLFTENYSSLFSLDNYTLTTYGSGTFINSTTNIFGPGSINNQGSITLGSNSYLSITGSYSANGLEPVTGNLGTINVNGGELDINSADLQNANLNVYNSGKTVGLITSISKISGNINIFSGGKYVDYASNINGTMYNGGYFYPQGAIINGTYNQSQSGFMTIGIVGNNMPSLPFGVAPYNPNPFLQVNGTANISGTLIVHALYGDFSYLQGAKPSQVTFSSGNHYSIIQAKSVRGFFTNNVFIDDVASNSGSTSVVSSTIDGLTPYVAYTPSSVQLWLCNGSYCGPAGAVPFNVVNPQAIGNRQAKSSNASSYMSETTAIVDNIIGGAPSGAWAKAIGNFGHISGYNSSGYGILLGYGFHADNHYGSWTFGPTFSFGYNSIGDQYTNVDTHSYGLWLYGGWNKDQFKVTSVIGGGLTNNSGTGTVFGIQSGSQYHGSFYDVAIRPSYWINFGHSFVISPRVTLNWGRSLTSGFSENFLGYNYYISGQTSGFFTASPAVLVGDHLSVSKIKIFPQLRVGINENAGPATNIGIPHTQGTAEARVDVEESNRLRSVLSWKYIYGGGSGYGFNTIVASVKYHW